MSPLDSYGYRSLLVFHDHMIDMGLINSCTNIRVRTALYRGALARQCGFHIYLKMCTININKNNNFRKCIIYSGFYLNFRPKNEQTAWPIHHSLIQPYSVQFPFLPIESLLKLFTVWLVFLFCVLSFTSQSKCALYEYDI